MRVRPLRSALAASVLVALGACTLPGDETETQSPQSTGEAESEATPEAEPLESLGEFEGRFDPETGELSIRAVGEGLPTPSLEPQADNLGSVPGSSTGVPAGGGVVAFSPSAPTSSGCPGGGNRCGTIRLVNRTSTNTVLRNVYAVVTEITPGWSLVSTDDPRAFTGLPSNVGRYYYEHLRPSNWPNASLTPSTGGTVGFRGDRRWSFKKAAGVTSDEFFFRFGIYARRVTCTPQVAEELPSDDAYNPTEDRDCDGVPGISRSRTLFVDPSLGDDSLTVADPTDYRGSLRSPFRTIGAAVAQASTTRHTIAIGGSFGTMTSSLNLTGAGANVRYLVGQYDTTNGFANRLLSPTNLTFSNTTYGVYRVNATQPFYVEGINLSVNSSSSSTPSVYAIFNSAANATGASVTLRDVSLRAVATAPGSNGTSGSTGLNGYSGTTPSGRSGGAGGASRTCANGSSGAGGRGGDGGKGLLTNGDPGANGTNANPGGAGGAGGAGGSGDFGGGDDGDPGAPGANGANGTPGSIGTANLSLAPSQHFDGSGFLFSKHAGTGGTGGRGAFGVFSYTPSGSAALRYIGNVTISVTGSRGGMGGDGASGGTGGMGGGGAPDWGGKGGKGGDGGASGAGAGGNGGPAICAVLKGADPDTTGAFVTCNPTPGAAGSNGIRGVVPSSTPAAGYSAVSLKF